jgi:hypothetical protein
MTMESKPYMKRVSRAWLVLIAGLFFLSASSLAADTYRWKDKDGKVHYGATVPAEYAEQPYDILNSAGMVIEHVEDTSVPMDVIVEKKLKERAPLISEDQRQIQTDRLLVIQYSSEEDIAAALEMQISQLGYDNKLIEQSFESTSRAIRDQIRQAANQQRAGRPISAEQQKGIDKLYARRSRDEQKRATMNNRENRIRARFQTDLERYRFLTSENTNVDEEQLDEEQVDEEQVNEEQVDQG